MSQKVDEKVVFDLPGVCASFVDDTGLENIVVGVLSILEKPRARTVVIEWAPLDDIEGSELSSDKNVRALRNRNGRLKFSVEVRDVRSFVLENQDSETEGRVKLLAKDGTNFAPLSFTMGGCGDFVVVLRNYCLLRRSTKHPNLMLVSDEKTEALEQSVSVLFKENSQDFMSKFWSNPYAAAITGLGKVTNYLQDRVLPNLLLDDFEKLDSEEQKYAMKSLHDLKKQEETEDECENLRVHHADGYEIVQYALPARPTMHRSNPVTKLEWQSHVAENGQILGVDELKRRIFKGGLEPELRKHVWNFLLNVFDWSSSDVDRNLIKAQKQDYYYRMKLQWKTITEDQQSRFSEFRDRAALIDKDVTRTDRNHAFFEGDNNSNLTILKDVLLTYVMYNFDLGYVQGMSDLLSPLIVVMENEVDAFWAFVGFMDQIMFNFEMDQKSIKQQLSRIRDLLQVVNPSLANHLESHDSDNMYFCFRWILVWFKREFSFSDITRLWEVLWTGLPCKNFHLIFALAILEMQKDIIMENKFGFTEVLKHVNDLSMKLDLTQLLNVADGIFCQLDGSRDNLPDFVCDYLGFERHSGANSVQRSRYDDWSKQAKPRTGSAPGCVKRV